MRKIVCLILLVCLCGCSAVINSKQIHADKNAVDISDRVDRREAVALARYHILTSGFSDRLVSLTPYRTFFRETWYKDGEPMEYLVPPRDRTGIDFKRTWTMYFKDRDYCWFNFFPVVPFRVVVDADTGAVATWGLDRLGAKDDLKRIKK